MQPLVDAIRAITDQQLEDRVIYLRPAARE
jgi:hypothetical protein